MPDPISKKKIWMVAGGVLAVFIAGTLFATWKYIRAEKAAYERRDEAKNTEQNITWGIEAYRMGADEEVKTFFSRLGSSATDAQKLDGWRGAVFGTKEAEGAVMAYFAKDPSPEFDTAAVREARGSFLFLMRDFTGAEQEFRKANAHDPQNEHAIRGIAKSLREQGQFNEAVRWNLEAVKLHPQNAAVWLGLGRTYQMMGENEKGLEAIETALRLSPNLGEAHVVKARILLAKDSYDAALESSHQAVSILETPRGAPQQPIAHINIMTGYMVRASIFEAKKDAQNAIKDYEHALSMPAYSEYHEFFQNKARERLTALREQR